MRQKNFGALLLVLFLVAALALTGCQQAGEPAGEADEVAGEAREADVVVIGGGGAGLAAAVSAAENGAEVILLEKMTMLGGNTIRSGGYYNAVDPERQEPLGIEDSIDHHYQQTIEGGDNEGDPALVRILVENALDALHWLEDYGMEFTDKVVAIQGAMWERSHVPAESGGYGYIQTLEKAARDLGVEILLETKAEKLLTDEEGRVVGVKATGADGEELEFRARNGVVLASGGFGANVEMRVKYDPRLTESFPTTNHPGATGDGILMAQELEAGVTGMEHIQLLPLADPKSGSSQHKVVTEIQSTIMVNREGKRFVNEDNRRDVLSAAIMEQTDGICFVINDAREAPEYNNYGEKVEDLVEQGYVYKADTLEELAEIADIDAEALVQTVKEFNEAVAKQSDSFGRKVWGNTIEVGPFYATPRCPSIHHTMGGLTINTETQVLKTDGTVIPGLYAAGEVTGGIHGTNRLGGNALADIIVFGRIAGRNAAQGL
ncbi:MAG: flavocytochrome c [bacterium]